MTRPQEQAVIKELRVNRRVQPAQLLAESSRWNIMHRSPCLCTAQRLRASPQLRPDSLNAQPAHACGV